MPRYVSAVVATAVTLALGAGLFAGPLAPPAGPVASTPGPEPRTAINATNTPGDADSIYRISQPGSYYLAGNISMVAGSAAAAIEIAASNVTIDLNGFSLIGAAGSLSGIRTQDGTRSNITIRNGVISGFTAHGIDLATAGAGVNAVVDGVQVASCAGSGVLVGVSSSIRNSAARSNGISGIVTGSDSIIESCTAYDHPIFGFSTSNGCTVTRCVATSCSTVGFKLGHGCNVTSCTATVSAGTGFDGAGVCVFHDCVAYAVNGHGFTVEFSSSVIGCAVSFAGLDGIRASTSCIILNNTCVSCGSFTSDGAGINVTGFRSRIEGNACSGSDRGIVVGGGQNLIIRNDCSGNTTNFQLFANNRWGPVIDITANNGSVVNGNSAASNLTSTDPNANFAH